ncbi:MAG: 4-hydroxy-3-methylbut-2-enyl diphosphate reductase [Synergistaceae bacterium]|jgi:4-hydroxy-3-methylbut-2-enyl diphosphate reductase|nr:4-hydroxy-3-methylbut-2-enyl diphosphate reductase [Synergistaceae bacterium]
MNLVVASPTGLCFGVRRAIGQLERALAERGTVYSLGSPIHNPQEVARLSALGLRVAESADEVPAGAVAFVRAHGASKSELEYMRERCGVVEDGTCPFVRTAQERAESLSNEGYKVMILGDSRHPEVRGILGHIEGESLVISGESDIDPKKRHKRLGILSQTTQWEASLAAVVSKLVLLADEIKVYNTICRATIERQESIRRLGAQVDGIVVIGGKNSANTRKLVEIAESLGVLTAWVEHPDELDWRWMRGKSSIGVAAGGSTPDWLINEITEKIKRL